MTSLLRCRYLAATERPAGGFTLIEILVVLTLIALLLTIALPRYFGSLERARDTILVENLRAMREGIDRFHADAGRYPETLDELVTKHYFKAMPVDPVTESAATWLLEPPPDPQEKGIYNVRSGAEGKSRSGIAFKAL